MEHHHYPDHRGWRLCVTPTEPSEEPRYIGHAVRATRPHRVVMAEGSSEAAALEDLHRQVDALEGAAGDVAGSTGLSAGKPEHHDEPGQDEGIEQGRRHPGPPTRGPRSR